MNWLELFAGGGGVTTGLHQAGHRVSAAIELVPAIAACYQANHPDTKLFVSDLRDVTLSDLPHNITAIWASPVCKQDSKARNKRLAMREDASIGLAILPYLKAIQPELFILENVKQYQNNPALTTIIAYLSRHYTISLRVLDAANYGIPQHRERLILQAHRGGIVWPNYAPQRKSWYEALSDLLDVMEESELAPWQQQLWKPEYDALLPVMVHGHYDFRDKGDPKQLDVLPAHFPARTVTASHNSTQKRIVLSPDRVIRMTPHGAARLQSFPDAYIWPSKVTLASEIIGNAVPPLLVQQLTSAYAARNVEVAA